MNQRPGRGTTIGTVRVLTAVVPVVVCHIIDVVPLTILARLSRNRQPTDLNESPWLGSV
jgi:hypothetical protein